MSTSTPSAEARRLGFDDVPALMRRMSGDEKHLSVAASTLDVLWVLYDRVLRVTPETAADPGRDRLLLSKGHGPEAYYAILAAKGFFPLDWLDGFATYDSPLGHHPDRALIPGVELSSGSLGHGLPIAVGLTLGLRAAGQPDARVFCVVGDGELDEGSNAEAIAIAGRLGLERLSVVVMDNGSSTLGWPGDIERRFTLEGWESRTVDGRDHDALEAALSAAAAGRPSVVVATIREG